jgi:molybdopterin biosynthesis enzyme MoaB
MRLQGRQHTPLAALSRSTAGTRGKTLIVNLPGSPKGAIESLNAIVDLVPHIVKLLHGETAHQSDSKLEVSAEHP